MGKRYSKLIYICCRVIAILSYSANLLAERASPFPQYMAGLKAENNEQRRTLLEKCLSPLQKQTQRQTINRWKNTFYERLISY